MEFVTELQQVKTSQKSTAYVSQCVYDEECFGAGRGQCFASSSSACKWLAYGMATVAFGEKIDGLIEIEHR